MENITEKLTLEHLAPYLPYSPKVQTEDGIYDVEGWSNDIGIMLNTIDYGFNAVPSCNLVLRPMSDLTWQMLSDLNFNSHKDYLTIEREHWISIKGQEEWVNDIPFGKTQWLAKNHYDYNGLIEKGLAISIHDIKED